MTPTRFWSASCAMVLMLAGAWCEAAEVRFEQDADCVKVFLDDDYFTTYLLNEGQNPVFWPIVGPSGERMTRNYPFEKGTPNEAVDHPHHRSLWFTHGEINGVNFWHTSDVAGLIKHLEFTKVEAPTLVEKCAWVSRDGKPVMTDERTLTFGADATGRWIDFDIAVTASSGDVVFTDTKEGSFGLRVPGTLDVNRKMGGRIINSEGQENDAAWGKRAAWVDYNGTLNDKEIGITIMNHPKSAFYPTYWHVRTYGLFAANPFGLHDFLNDKNNKLGEYTLPAGETIHFMYRVYFHDGDEVSGKVKENFEQYSK